MMKLFPFTSLSLTLLLSSLSLLFGEPPRPKEEQAAQVDPALEDKKNEIISPYITYPLLPEKALEVLDFWFGYLPNSEYFPPNKTQLWLSNSPVVRQEIESKFGEDIKKAAQGDYNQWRETARGRLALILLLDEFPHLVYPNQPRAYAVEPMARGIMLEGLHKGDENMLYPIEKAFFYLPLLQAEDPELQKISVDAYQKLVNQSPVAIRSRMIPFLRRALFNQEIIQKYGRFPDKSKILGRDLTKEELSYLNKP